MKSILQPCMTTEKEVHTVYQWHSACDKAVLLSLAVARRRTCTVGVFAYSTVLPHCKEISRKELSRLASDACIADISNIELRRCRSQAMPASCNAHVLLQSPCSDMFMHVCRSISFRTVAVALQGTVAMDP
jgi:hypothetical protein